MKTFLRENGFRNEDAKGIVVKGYNVPFRATKWGEYIPEPKEAIRMAETCGVGSRDYAIILTLGFSGLRQSTLRAIRFKDVELELEKGHKNVCITVSDEMKKLVPDAAKGRMPYYVFTTELATEAWRMYLKQRIDNYGQIPEDAPLFSTKCTRISERNTRNSTVLSKRELERIVKTAAMRAGIKDWKLVTPHKLRKTFESFLRNQPPECRLDYKDQEFFMGHKLPGSQDNYYDRTKIETMRAKFAKLVVEQDPAVQTTLAMARDLGLDPQLLKSELARSLGRDPTQPEETENLRKKIKEKIENRRPDTVKVQRIIEEKEFEGKMAEGWSFKGSLPNGKIIIERDEEQPKDQASNKDETVTDKDMPSGESADKSAKDSNPGLDPTKSEDGQK